jgi:hypothetical protein
MASPIQHGLKQGDALLPLLFNFSLEHAVRNVQKIRGCLKLNWTHQLLACADVVSMVGENRNTTYNKNPEVLLQTTKEDGLEEVNTEGIKYVFQSRHQNHNLLIANKSFQNVG